MTRRTATGTSTGYVQLDRKNFQKTIEGKPVDLYTIKNGSGMAVAITNHGARVEQILVPDSNGRLGDVALGYETIDRAIAGQISMGAFIGRFANRIAKGRFTLNGHEYRLALNDGPNNLHGGAKGSRFVVFEARQIDGASVEMSYMFRDGEENFPGNLTTRAIYSVTDDNELILAFDAVTDKPTVVNFTGHTFFNLAGQGTGDVLNHVMTINADRFLPVDDTRIPTGELRAVVGTPFDFTRAEKIGARIDQPDQQLKYGSGYDHCYVLNKKNNELSLAARILDPRSGRVMEVHTTEPAMQLYSGQFLEGKQPRDIGKGGAVYTPHTGFCVEPQHFPDSPNQPSFPSTTLNAGERYSGKIVYKFSVAR
jgi:aldose 1-epimerase